MVGVFLHCCLCHRRLLAVIIVRSCGFHCVQALLEQEAQLGNNIESLKKEIEVCVPWLGTLTLPRAHLPDSRTRFEVLCSLP